MTSPQNTIQLRRILWYYYMALRTQRAHFAVMLGAYTLGIVIVEVALPLVVRTIIDTVTALQQTPGMTPDLWKLFGLFVALVLAHEVFFRIADFTIIAIEAQLVRRLEHMVLDRLAEHSAGFFARQFTGSLIAQAKRFVQNAMQLLEIGIFHLWWSGLKIPAIIITLFVIAPQIASLFVVWSIVYGGVVWWFLRRGVPYDTATAQMDSRVTGRFSDIITNMFTVKMFARYAQERAQFAEVTKQQQTAQLRASRFEIFQVLVQGALFALLNIGSLSYALVLWGHGALSVGTIVIIQLYIGKMFASLWPLGRALKRFMRALTDAQEMVDIFDMPRDIADPAHPAPCRMTRGTITFDNVQFAYDDGAQHVVSNVSLTIPAGQKVGLVGTSGAGKSTITKLLLRFADVSAGAIRIDGQDIRAVRQDDVRRAIAAVPQEPLLFHRSIRENIAYGNPTASKEEIVRAAKMAHAHEFISALPQGYDTLVGERGVKLSGGERQRIAIARAILKDAPIIVMDEATSALDSVSERYIQDAMEELIRGRTALVVAHRLSTLTKMDRIIVMESGRIVEDGTHTELLARNGRYAQFWRQQSGGFVTE